MTAERDGISVAISTRNRADALDRCLASLCAGSLLPADVVVVDQSDNTLSVGVVERHRARSLPVRRIGHTGRGLGASQNIAFAHAACAQVAVIDDDCVADREWLATIANRFRMRGDLDGITGRVLPLPPAGERTFAVSSRVSEIEREFVGESLPWEVGSGNNFALRRQAYLRIGGCDERLGPGSPTDGGVDMDLFYRLTYSGSRILYEPAAVVYHERQTRAERRARRPMYGRGMGAAIALWRRHGLPGANQVLGAWIRLRLRQMRLAITRGDWADVRDELTMLASTRQGLAQGRELATRPRTSPKSVITGAQ